MLKALNVSPDTCYLIDADISRYIGLSNTSRYNVCHLFQFRLSAVSVNRTPLVSRVRGIKMQLCISKNDMWISLDQSAPSDFFEAVAKANRSLRELFSSNIFSP